MFYNPGNSEYSHENEFQRQQADDGKRIRKPRPKTSVEHSREKDESIPSIKIHGVEFKKNHLAPYERIEMLFINQKNGGNIPHPIFTEMLELKQSDHNAEWNETARWVKFEEDVETGGNRWSKPHVATLSLHSWFQLRSCFLSGAVILDMNATNFTEVVDNFLDHFLSTGSIDNDKSDKLREIFLRKHNHQFEHEAKYPGHKILTKVRSLAEIGRQQSKEKSLQSSLSTISSTEGNVIPEEPHDDKLKKRLERLGTEGSIKQTSVSRESSFKEHIKKNLSKDRLSRNGSFKDHIIKQSSVKDHLSRDNSLRESREGSFVHAFKGNWNFYRKMPADSEATNVFVGHLDFIDNPMSVFIRLKQASLLGDVCEVPIPTRFLFFLVGPYDCEWQHHEIGRAVGAIMIDEVFHEVAYKAHERNDLVDGIDEFLDQVTILPPGEWDPNIRIEPPAVVPTQEKRIFPSVSPPTVPVKIVTKPSADLPEDPTLKRTGRLFGCLFNDIQRKLKFYKSDFRDALHLQSFAAFIYIYFALLAPIVAFGGIYKESTGRRIAVVENILGCSISGILFALFSAQPMAIIASTGPMLVFEKLMYEMCKGKLDYLAFRYWINIWSAIILFVLVAADASTIVSYITRFTEESFIVLVAFVFIEKAISKVLASSYSAPIVAFDEKDLVPNPYCACVQPNVNFSESATSLTVSAYTNKTLLNVNLSSCLENNGELENPLGHCYFMYDVLFMSIILALGTFFFSYSFYNLKNSIYFPRKVRSFLSLFGVIIAIIFMSLLDHWVGLATPKLYVPSDFQPTFHDRGWLIDPFHGNPYWTVVLAIIPAFLLCILIFCDHNVTLVVVNRKENKLKKGCGYHLDLFILCFTLVISGVLGLPIFVASTITSLNHVKALKIEQEFQAPGEKPTLLGVREQRVTALLVYIFIGLSILMTKVLTYIPMAVLYGVFLYMAISTLEGVQLIDRLLLFVTPAKYQKDFIYLRHVPISRIHLFTIIQLACLGFMFVVKEIDAISIIFPLMLIGTAVVRKLLEYVYTEDELHYLDDQVPEVILREKEDDTKTELSNADELPKPVSAFHIPLASGNVMKIPKLSVIGRGINLSEEVNKSGLWKQIASESSFGSKEGLESRFNKMIPQHFRNLD